MAGWCPMVHTVRNPETGEVLGFFPSVESVMLAAARGGWQNWTAECRHPTLAEMTEFFNAQPRGKRYVHSYPDQSPDHRDSP